VEDRRHRRLLWDDVRVAKERLSRAQSADLVLPLLNAEVHLTREELERLAQPLLEQTVKVTQGAMRWADKRGARATAGVFLVGGASRIPLLATLLHRALGQAPVAIEQPELVVAEGSLFAMSVRPTDPAATVVVSPVPLATPVSPAPVPQMAPVLQKAFAPGRAAPRTTQMTPTRAMPQLPPTPVSPAVVHVQAARPYRDRRRGGGFASFVRWVFVTVLLACTLVVSAYVAYKLALREPLLPVRVAWDKIM
jgi:hypothetical protein